MLLLCGTANRPLADEIARHMGLPMGDATVKRFADGEIFVRINQNARGGMCSSSSRRRRRATTSWSCCC
jgi:phosphoribosylpyrophosphate synthetase